MNDKIRKRLENAVNKGFATAQRGTEDYAYIKGMMEVCQQIFLCRFDIKTNTWKFRDKPEQKPAVRAKTATKKPAKRK